MKRLFYYSSVKNLGDIVNENIFRDVLGVPVKQSQDYKANYFGIGSILHRAFIYNNPNKNRIRNFNRNKFKWIAKQIGNSPLVIWGSGFMHDEVRGVKQYRELKVMALRGRLSKSIMASLLQTDLTNIALGDPGLLMNRLVSVTSEKNYALGVIPHYVDYNNELIDNFIDENPRSVKINIVGNPLEVLKKIGECETILSTSLHGLIAADSLGIPSKWIRVSDKMAGGDFKFHDYYSVFNIKSRVMDLRKCTECIVTPESIIEEYTITSEQVETINSNLMRAFKPIS